VSRHSKVIHTVLSERAFAEMKEGGGA